MTIRIALFKHVGHNSDYRCVWQESMMNLEGILSGYIRTSDWVDVDLPERTREDQIPEELVQLDAKLDEVKADFSRKIAALEEARANLLSLTDARVLA